jgi:hypothetical protein
VESIRRGTKAESQAPPAPAAPQGAYAEWRKHVAALLERQGISSTVMRERAWRNLFIRSATPEEAAYRAAIEAHNMP